MAERTRKKYNKDCDFVIPNDEDSDLYYETAFKNIVGNAVQAFDKEEEWKYIESNIDSESLKRSIIAIILYIFCSQTTMTLN